MYIRHFIAIVLWMIATLYYTCGVGMDQNVTSLYQIYKLELIHKHESKLTPRVLWVLSILSSFFFPLFLVIILFRFSFAQFSAIHLPL